MSGPDLDELFGIQTCISRLTENSLLLSCMDQPVNVYKKINAVFVSVIRNLSATYKEQYTMSMLERT